MVDIEFYVDNKVETIKAEITSHAFNWWQGHDAEYKIHITFEKKISESSVYYRLSINDEPFDIQIDKKYEWVKDGYKQIDDPKFQEIVKELIDKFTI